MTQTKAKKPKKDSWISGGNGRVKSLEVPPAFYAMLPHFSQMHGEAKEEKLHQKETKKRQRRKKSVGSSPGIIPGRSRALG